MSFVAAAECKLPVSAEAAFDRLADHASWEQWMPPGFRPVGPSPGALREGDKVRIRVTHAPAPSPIQVTVVRRPHEITWTGGVPGLLWAEHSFYFEEEPGGVRVRSVETWSGALTVLVKGLVLPLAQKIASEQLEGLARAVGA